MEVKLKDVDERYAAEEDNDKLDELEKEKNQIEEKVLEMRETLKVIDETKKGIIQHINSKWISFSKENKAPEAKIEIDWKSGDIKLMADGKELTDFSGLFGKYLEAEKSKSLLEGSNIDPIYKKVIERGITPALITKIEKIEKLKQTLQQSKNPLTKSLL